MAFSATNYFSNSIVGVPQVAGEVDVYEVHTSPKFAIGTKFERQDGAVFRYCHFGAAVSAGVLVAPQASGSTAQMITQATNYLLGPSSSYQQEKDPKGVYPGAKGSRFVLLSSVALTCAANQLAGCHLNIGYGTGAGFIYRIKGNDANSATATNYSKLELWDPLQAAIDTTSSASVAPCRWQNLGLAASNTDLGVVVGATMNTNNTSIGWGWVITKGMATVKMDGLNVLAGGDALLAPGKPAILSTAGAVCSIVSSGNLTTGLMIKPIVGIVATVGSNGISQGIVDLNLA
jgi:hypothetical protein